MVRGSVTVGTQQGELGEQGISYRELGMGCERTLSGGAGMDWGRRGHQGHR